MTSKAKIGLLFAVLGYVIVVAIGVLALSLHVDPAGLIYAAPVSILFATEDPTWSGLLVVVAPLNALLYGGLAVAVASSIHFLQRKKEEG